MKQLQPTKLHVIQVPIEATNFKKTCIRFSKKFGLYYEIGRDYNHIRIGFDFKILGTVTKDVISFDIEPYLEIDNSLGIDYSLSNGKFFKLYTDEFEECVKIISTTNDYRAFYSLLNANDLYFENPYQKQWNDLCKWGHGDFAKDGKTAMELYFAAKEKVIKGKLLILEEI
jgi:hypothetical protein